MLAEEVVYCIVALFLLIEEGERVVDGKLLELGLGDLLENFEVVGLPQDDLI